MTTADLLDGAAVKRMVGDVIAHFGRLDILVNNGGGIVGSGSAVHPLTHDDTAFERTLCLDLTSTYLRDARRTSADGASGTMVRVDVHRLWLCETSAAALWPVLPRSTWVVGADAGARPPAGREQPRSTRVSPGWNSRGPRRL